MALGWGGLTNSKLNHNLTHLAITVLLFNFDYRKFLLKLLKDDEKVTQSVPYTEIFSRIDFSSILRWQVSFIVNYKFMQVKIEIN